MSFTESHVVASYSGLFEGLSSVIKLELINSLSNSLKADEKQKYITFFKSFGAFASDKSAEEIIGDIKTSRKFHNKEIKL